MTNATGQSSQVLLRTLLAVAGYLAGVAVVLCSAAPAGSLAGTYVYDSSGVALTAAGVGSPASGAGSQAPGSANGPAAMVNVAGDATTAPALPTATPSAARGGAGASNAANGARLSEQLRLTERYGRGGVRELADGRMRFYGELTPAKTPGEMAGARLVREWNPATGAQRTWYETLGHNGVIRIVRPESGGPKVHYTFDAQGNYTGPR